MKQYDRVYAEIDLDAIWQNMKAMQAHLLSGTKMCGVIKTDGYGHGAVPVARTIEEFVWGYAVASLDEGVNLRENHIEKPIIVLGSVFEARYEQAVDLDIRLSIFQEKRARQLDETAKKLGKKAKIHVAVDTGMGRIGAVPNEEAVQLVKRISNMKNIEIEGVFTHLARADELDKTSANQQIEKFRWFCGRLEEEGISIPIKHCANSAGIIELQEANMDMVRAGISIYGFYPSDEVQTNQVHLKPAMSIRSYVTYVSKMPAKATIGYGGTYVTPCEQTIAVVGIGYGDGYPRKLSNCGYVLIHGKKAPICGRICMDQIMVNVSEIENVEEGDIVTIVGRDGQEQITVEELTAMTGSFSYEFVCNVGKRVPRIYLREGRVIGTRDWFHEEVSF